MQMAIDEDNLSILINTMSALADSLLLFRHMDEAIFYYNQLRQLCGFVGKVKRKVEALMSLAKCSKLIENYNGAIKILRTALQYAWDNNLREQELEIYDQLGITYFHTGELKKSKYYHKRAVENQFEPEKSPFRDLYISMLANTKATYGKTKNITASVLSKLSLPVSLKEASRSNIDTVGNKSCSSDGQALERKVKLGLKVQPGVLLEFILRDHDFSSELPSPRVEKYESKEKKKR